MTYKIIVHPEAAKEIGALDNRVRQIILKQIKKLSNRPGLGIQLGHKMGMDLSEYRKIYADKKKIRIVYKIVTEKIAVFFLDQFNQCEAFPSYSQSFQ